MQIGRERHTHAHRCCTLSLTHNTHTHAVTLPPAQPVYIISSVWFCSLLNGLGIWDIFFPPSLPLSLSVPLSLSLPPFTHFLPSSFLSFLPLSLSPSSRLCLSVFPLSQALSFTPDFPSCLSSSILCLTLFSLLFIRHTCTHNTVYVCMFLLYSPSPTPLLKYYFNLLHLLLSFISYPCPPFSSLCLSLNKVYSGVLPATK